MIYSTDKKPVTLASKKVPNGGWGDHTVTVDGMVPHFNGWATDCPTARETP